MVVDKLHDDPAGRLAVKADVQSGLELVADPLVGTHPTRPVRDDENGLVALSDFGDDHVHALELPSPDKGVLRDSGLTAARQKQGGGEGNESGPEAVAPHSLVVGAGGRVGLKARASMNIGCS